MRFLPVLAIAAAAVGAPAGSETTLRLTTREPAGRFEVAREIVSRAPDAVEIRVVRIVNDAAAAFSITVSLRSGPGCTGPPVAARVGSFSLFPADRPGTFLLRTSAAFERVREAAGARPCGAQLELELVPVPRKAPTPEIEVFVSPPRWRAASEAPDSDGARREER